MKRRRYVKYVGVSAGTFASGCLRLASDGSGSGGGTTDSTATTATETEERTATTTTTTASGPSPAFDLVNPITHWNEFGDVGSNVTDAFGSGGEIMVGYRFEVPITGGEIRFVHQAKVYDDGTVIDQHTTDPVEEEFDDDGFDRREEWISFGNEGEWALKEYEIEVVVRDLLNGTQARREGVTFALNEPLVGDEARLLNAHIPSPVRVGEPFDYALEFENRSNRDGSIVSPLSGKRGDDDTWTPLEDTFRLNVAAGDPRTLRVEDATFDQAGTFTYRIDDIDEKFSFTVEE